MSEVISRPSAARGRGSGRGGRGGFAGRGGRRTNGDRADYKSADDSLGAFDDEGDFAELRKQYGGKTSVIREMFPDWSEVDILFALQETNGDENEAVTRIAEGTISQWGEVSKPKKTTRTKAKDTSTPTNTESSANPRNARGGRGAADVGRGRGRATERGGRGGRGRSTRAPTNGTRGKDGQLSVPTEESSVWDDDKTKVDETEDAPVAPEKPAAAELPKAAAAAAAPPVKTWASMLRQSTAPKVIPAAPKEPPAPKPAESIEPTPVPEPVQAEPEPEPEPVQPEAEPEVEIETTPVVEPAEPVVAPAAAEPAVELPPSQDELTKTNLEQVVDESKPPATDTAASTTADSWDPRQSPVSATATPISAAQQQHQAQRASSGFVATALKATTERSTRPSSFQRRILDQEEAVRMPGNREVDRAAVQFGAFNLNESEEDIDGEREEPETRAQPPADSPVSHPRTSLPPAAQPVAIPEAFSQKTTTGPPPGITAPAPAAASAQASTPSQITAQPLASNTQQFGRFGQTTQEVPATQPKPIDPFHQQNTQSTQPSFDNFTSQTTQAQAQQQAAAFSSAPREYSSYYTSGQQERTPYNNFYGQHFGQQQGAHGQPEPSQQRPFGAYNASQSDNLSQYPQSGAAHNQPRFSGTNEAQNSGHSTPNPATQAQQQQPQGQQQQGGAPDSQQQTHGQQYPGYNHPYYSNPYYHQYYQGYGQGGFGPYAKGGMYGQPYVSPNAPYDHTSSPGTFGPSSLHRDSPLGSGLGDYGRTGSAQATGQSGLGGSTFGSGHDGFSRGGSSFQSQGQGFNAQTQPNTGASADELKPFGDAKSASGPSPSLGGPRPGSATNTAPGGQSGSLPPPQTSQMGGAYAGYPSHLQGHGLHGSGYGMGGGAGSQHSTPYGSYGQGGFSSGYYGGNQQQQGQGQGQQQQQQQQRGGWGGNYH